MLFIDLESRKILNPNILKETYLIGGDNSVSWNGRDNTEGALILRTQRSQDHNLVSASAEWIIDPPV
jgi:hypothetical protein